MKIGFDLDSVLATQHIPSIILITGNHFAEDQYCGTLIHQLIPSMFLGKNDVAVIITGRMPRLSPITKEWCKLHFPQIKVYEARTAQWKSTSPEELERWYDETAKNKAVIINKQKIDVYFEDMPETVERLRKLCPNCRIIQYGGRVR